MKRLSTRCMNGIENNRNKKQEEINSGPRKKTLDFLTQFARVYRAEPLFDEKVCGYILN